MTIALNQDQTDELHVQKYIECKRRLDELFVWTEETDVFAKHFGESVTFSGIRRDPEIMMVEGRTGSGKTHLARYLVSLFPPRQKNTGLYKVDTVPVLYHELSTTKTVKELVMDLCHAVNLYFAKSTSEFMLTKQLQERLELLETRAIIMDEAGHLDYKKQGKGHENLLKWFKSFANKSALSFVLLSVPGDLKFINVEDDQGQLLRRADNGHSLSAMPIPKDSQSIFCYFIDQYLAVLSDSGIYQVQDSLALNDYYRFYLASFGYSGGVGKLFGCLLSLLLSNGSYAEGIPFKELMKSVVTRCNLQAFHGGKTIVNPFDFRDSQVLTEINRIKIEG